MLEDYVKEMNIVYNEKEVQEKLREYKDTKNITIRNEIIEMCLPLLLYCVNTSGKYVDISKEELYSYACEGLIVAIDNFDCSSNSSFRFYALHCIVTKIMLGASIVSGVRPKNSYMSFLKNKDKIEKETGKKLANNIELLDVILNRMMDHFLISMSTADTIKKSYIASHPLSLSTDKIEEKYDGVSLIEERVDSQIFADKYLGDKLHFLTDREKKIFRLIYGFDGDIYSRTEVNKIFNGSKNYINALENHAVGKLRAIVKR